MSIISKLDIFGSDPSFHHQQKQVISTWESKLLSVGLIIASIMISFSIVINLWIPKGDLPITSGLGDGLDLKINPFIIAIIYTFKEQKGIFTFEHEDGRLIQPTKCPKYFTQNKIVDCFKTQTIDTGNLDGDEIIMFGDKNISPRILLQKFSIDVQLQNRQPTNFLDIQYFDFSTLLQFKKVKLLTYDSLLNSQPSSVSAGILDYNTIRTGNLINLLIGEQFSRFSFQNKPTCLQYKVIRQPILKILAAVTSWFQTCCSIAAFLFLFNIVILIKSIGQKLFAYHGIQRKSTTAKIYLYSFLDNIGLAGIIISLTNFMKEQAKMIDKMNEKCSIENILRNTNQIQIISKCKSSIQQQNNISSSEINSSTFIEFHQVQIESKQESQQFKQKIFVKQKNIFVKIFEKLNSNGICAAFSSKDEKKTSTFSFCISIIGIILIMTLIWQFGGLDTSPQPDFQFIINKDNFFQLGSQQNPFYVYLTSEGQQVFIQDDSVFFIKMNKNYEIVETYAPVKNCTSTKKGMQGMIYNYCLSNIFNFKRNSTFNEKFGILVNQTMDLDLNIKYNGVNIFFDHLEESIINKSVSLLYSGNHQSYVTLIHQITQTSSRSFIQISDIQEQSYHFCQSSDICVSFTLLSEQSTLKTYEKSVYYVFQNVWSLNYIFFSILLAMVIKPYNSNIAKKSTIEQVNKKRKTLQENFQEDEIFDFPNLIQRIDSEFSSKKHILPFLKQEFNSIQKLKS